MYRARMHDSVSTHKAKVASTSEAEDGFVHARCTVASSAFLARRLLAPLLDHILGKHIQYILHCQVRTNQQGAEIFQGVVLDCQISNHARLVEEFRDLTDEVAVQYTGDR